MQLLSSRSRKSRSDVEYDPRNPRDPFSLEGGDCTVNITQVQIRPVKSDGKTRAMVSVVFDAAFVVKELKIVEGPTGLFVSMPSRKVGTNGYRDIAHPITSAARKELHDAIMKAYNEQVNPQPPAAH